MRFAITGEAGFIASNLSKMISDSDNTFISLLSEDLLPGKYVSPTGESAPCVFSNTEQQWQRALEKNNIDVLVHNAAIVGTDVVALDPITSSLTNVAGCHIISRASNKANVKVCYMGTTVIYDTKNHQDSIITEKSSLNPTTLYGNQKLAGERIIKTTANDWMVIRPLFAYGGAGDNNSLIAKTIYAYLNKKNRLKMFLNPRKIKDYMHVDDYCSAVLLACEKDLWQNDYNVSSENPDNTHKIVEKISRVLGEDISELLEWYPETDYLGNHVLSSFKFRQASGWKPKISLDQGIEMSLETIRGSSGYNPLKYLESAIEKNIDLTEFY